MSVSFFAWASYCIQWLVSCAITDIMVCKYSKKKSRGEYSKILETAVLFDPVYSPMNWCTAVLSEGSLQHHSKSS
jgi:hypothetical protein